MQGQLDVPLDELGEMQAQALGTVFAADPPAVVVSSDLVRARDTAQAVCDHVGLPLIVDDIEEQLRDLGCKPLRREGEKEGRWVLLDFGDIVVHVQHQEERVFYALERLWKDCPVIPFVDRDRERAAGRS